MTKPDLEAASRFQAFCQMLVNFSGDGEDKMSMAMRVAAEKAYEATVALHAVMVKEKGGKSQDDPRPILDAADSKPENPEPQPSPSAEEDKPDDKPDESKPAAKGKGKAPRAKAS